MPLEPSVILTWTYFSTYCLIFVITSIWSAITIKQQHKQQKSTKEYSSIQNTNAQKNIYNTNISIELKEKTSTKHRGCKHYVRMWFKLTWQKKKIYISLAPHLFDQATDIGLILQYYSYMTNPTDNIHKSVDVIYWFVLSIAILLIHRLVSCFGVYLMTHNWFNVFLQSLDLLLIRSVWTSYKLGTDKPSTTQRYLCILEAIFEAMPQLLLSSVFIAKTGQFDILIVISLISSLWSLTSRVTSDDALFIHKDYESPQFSYKKCPCINPKYILRVLVRFIEISSRVSLLTIMWLNIGGLGTGIIILFEAIWLLAMCYRSGSIGCMGNLMYLLPDISYSDYYNDRECLEFSFAGFALYRWLSAYIYLILSTIFANIRFESPKIDIYQTRHSNTMNINTIGYAMFLYSWLCYFIWPYALMYGISSVSEVTDEFNGMRSRVLKTSVNAPENVSTQRNFENLMKMHDYMAILELMEFGKKIDSKEQQMLKKILGEKHAS
eukprot:176769_1